MNQILLVGLGGALGSIARFKLSGILLSHTLNWRFPMPTFVVNVAGCLVIGILAGLATKENYFSPELRVLLFTGLLGGFATFSAFGLETLMLIRRAEYTVAAFYAFSSVLAGLLVMWVGFSLVIAKS